MLEQPAASRNNPIAANRITSGNVIFTPPLKLARLYFPSEANTFSAISGSCFSMV